MPDRTVYTSRLTDHQQPKDSGSYFLYHHHAKGQQHPLEPTNKAKKHCNLGQLICYRIKGFAKVADHVTFPRNDTIHNIGDAGKCQNDRCPHWIFLNYVQPYDHWDQQQPKQRQNIGDRNDLILVLTFHET